MPFPNTQSLAELRRDLPDWWLGAAAMPARADWLHVLQVVAEIERIPERAREPMIVQIRFAWWRELIGEIYAGQLPRPHPLAARLAEIIATHALPQALWEGWMDAMAERFDPAEGADLASTEEWLFALGAHLLRTPMDTPREAEPWQELGRMWTLLHSLRLQAFSAQPEVTLVREAAAAGMTKTMAEPGGGQKFWRAHRRIVRHYLTLAAKAQSVDALHAALRPSRVALPLRLILSY